MNTSPSAIKRNSRTTEAAFHPVAYMTWFTKGLERAVDAGKSSMDLALAQNAEVLASCKKALIASSMPGSLLMDLAGQAFEGYVALHKSLTDMALEQSTVVIKAQECKRDDGEGKAETVKALDPRVAAEESVLERAPKQTEGVSDTGMQQSMVTSSPVRAGSDLDQLQVDTLLAKEIVDLIVQPGVIGEPAETVADIVRLQVDAKEIEDLASKPFKIKDVN